MDEVPKDHLLKLIKESRSIKEVLFKLGYSGAGTWYPIFKKKCEEFNIDWKAEMLPESGTHKRFSEDEIFIEGSSASQHALRNRYFYGNYSEYKCSICGINEWNNKPLTLRLDHINGHNTDDRLENLRWVCPNCDSQLDTYCGKNLKKRREERACVDCGKPIPKTARRTTLRCAKCANKRKRKVVKRPTKKELEELLKASSFVDVGKRFGVTDNAVRKWCRSYGISDKAKDYK